MTRQMSGQQSEARKRNERPVPDEAPLEESARGEVGRSGRASRRRLTRHEWALSPTPGWSWRLGGEEPVEEGAVAGEGDA